MSMTPSDPTPPDVVALVSRLIVEARVAGYNDPVYGALVIAAHALHLISAEVGRSRHPAGHATGGEVE